MDEQVTSALLDKDKNSTITFDDFPRESQTIRRLRSRSSHSGVISSNPLETSPVESAVSPLSHSDDREISELGLGEKRKNWASHPALITVDRHSNGKRSPVEHDLAAQMRYLTSIPESPGVRTSKVLSWISESEDMFEDTGASEEPAEGLLSPPMSPKRVSSDETDHAYSIVKAVCETHEIGPEAVQKLCDHVQADQQEHQELLALLNHLDKERKGYVSIEEFVGGLQSTCASTYLLPPNSPSLFSHEKVARSNVCISSLTEPFSSTPTRKMTHHASPPHWNSVATDLSQLSVLDPENFGFVAIEKLLQKWQGMGVEPPHNQNLMDAVSECLPMDASQRVNIGELFSTLEAAVLNDNHNSTLRQAALLTFRGEMSHLRSQLHQVSMERDGLQSTLQRTAEESRRLVQEGDEQVEKITRESEKKERENEQRVCERLREVEREKKEEAKRLQELIDMQKEKYEKEIVDLRRSEEFLKRELKLVREELKINFEEKEECVVSQLGDQSEIEIEHNESFRIITKLEELERENSELLEQNKVLYEQNRNLQDYVDELMADNAKVKQKYIFRKRRLQRQQSAPHFTTHDGRPHSGKRPSSAGRRSTIVPTLEFITEAPTVTVLGEEDLDTDREESDVHTTSSDDGLFAKSTASLLDEMQQDDKKVFLERELEELRQEKQGIEENCLLLEQQLQEQKDMNEFEKKRLLQRYRYKQCLLKKQIQNLEEQKRYLSSAKEGVHNQLQTLEDTLEKQLSDIHKLKDELSSKSGSDLCYSVPPHESVTDTDDLSSDVHIVTKESDGLCNYQRRVCELQHELDMALAEKKEMVIHNEAVERVCFESNEEIKKLRESQKEQNREIIRLRNELESSEVGLKLHQTDMQNLELQLQLLQKEIMIKERELELIKKKHELMDAPMNVMMDLYRVQEDKENLHRNLESTTSEAEIIHTFQQQDENMTDESEVEHKKQTCQDELAMKVNGYSGVVVQDVVTREEIVGTSGFESDTDCIQQELNAEKLVINDLRKRLELSEKHSQCLLLEVSEQKGILNIKDTLICDLKAMKERLMEKISHAERERQQTQLKLNEHIQVECQLRDNLKVAFELKNTKTNAVMDKATEDCDSPTMFSNVSLPVQSTTSVLSYEHDIVSEMKKQLQDLQVCLVQQQDSSSQNNQLILVQELLNASAVLKDKLQRENEQRLKELATIAEKELEIKCLEEKLNGHVFQIEQFYSDILDHVQRSLSLLQQRLESHICHCLDKLEAMSTAVVCLMDRMKCNQGQTKNLQKSHKKIHHTGVGNQPQMQQQWQSHLSDESDVNGHEDCRLSHDLIKEMEVVELNENKEGVFQRNEVQGNMKLCDEISILTGTAEMNIGKQEEKRVSVQRKEKIAVEGAHLTTSENEIFSDYLDLETSHEGDILKLDSASSETKILKAQNMSSELTVTPMSANTEEVDCSDLTQQAKDEISSLKRQLSEEKHLRHAVEMSIRVSQTEWQLQETQWLAEHEEEVRALKQRNSQLEQLLEETRSHYQEYIADLERENSVILQDLIAKQASLESEIEIKTEHQHQTQFERGSHSDNSVFLDVMEQLCKLWPSI